MLNALEKALMADWHLNEKTMLAIIGALGGLMVWAGTSLWWVSQESFQVAQAREDLSQIHKHVDDMDKDQKERSDRLIRLEEKTGNILDAVKDIQRKLDNAERRNSVPFRPEQP